MKIKILNYNEIKLFNNGQCGIKYTKHISRIVTLGLT